MMALYTTHVCPPLKFNSIVCNIGYTGDINLRVEMLGPCEPKLWVLFFLGGGGVKKNH